MFFIGQRGKRTRKRTRGGKKEKEKRKFEVLGVLRSEVFRVEGPRAVGFVGCRVFVG